ncbi:MAG: ABC transporter permease [Blautia sp.]|nr:ABC transporter permease [Blautia sp.]
MEAKNFMDVKYESVKFEHKGFGKRVKSMLAVDFRRMFTMRLFYVMAGICLVMPVLVLVMTSAFGGKPQGGAEAAAGMFENTWQIIGTASGAGGGMMMDMTAMCNINLLYFGAAVLVALFVSEDFRSGYAKNLFTVRADKDDYIVSKTIVCFAAAALLLLAFFAGAVIGGAIAGLSFEMGALSVGNIVMCMLCKIFLMSAFVSIYLTMSAFAKQRAWMGIVGGLVAGMLMFMMIPMMTPLDATVMHVVMCLAGGILFSVGMGFVGTALLKKIDLV